MECYLCNNEIEKMYQNVHVIEEKVMKPVKVCSSCYMCDVLEMDEKKAVENPIYLPIYMTDVSISNNSNCVYTGNTQSLSGEPDVTDHGHSFIINNQPDMYLIERSINEMIASINTINEQVEYLTNKE